MFRFSKPKPDEIDSFLAAQTDAELSYEEVGATRGELPEGYVHDQYSIVLGSGREVYETARECLRRWDQFGLGWTAIAWPHSPIRVGQVVGVLGHVCTLWSLNACKIVFVDEIETEAEHCFEYGYGTLPGHAGQGEELFHVRWDRNSDEVTYTIAAFSRPHEWLAKIFYPYMRIKQRQFKEESLRLMARLVRSFGSETAQDRSVKNPQVQSEVEPEII